jgi:hypothetical protein
VLYLGMKKAVARFGAEQSPARLLAVRTMRETQNPPVFRLEHRGILFFQAFMRLCAVWAFFFFVLRCTFVVSPAGRLCYTGRKGGMSANVAQV